MAISMKKCSKKVTNFNLCDLVLHMYLCAALFLRKNDVNLVESLRYRKLSLWPSLHSEHVEALVHCVHCSGQVSHSPPEGYNNHCNHSFGFKLKEVLGLLAHFTAAIGIKSHWTCLLTGMLAGQIQRDLT